MSDLLRFFHAQDKVRRRRAECEAADAKLELEQIRMRYAEIISQHQPLADIIDKDLLSPEYTLLRKKMHKVAAYVVYGKDSSAYIS